MESAEVERMLNGEVSADRLPQYLKQLHLAFLSNYKTLVETNFPTVRSEFALYNQLPVSVQLVIGSRADR
jgi:hypothetical protein